MKNRTEIETLALEMIETVRKDLINQIENARQEAMNSFEIWKNEQMEKLEHIISEFDKLEKSANAFETLRQTCLKLQAVVEVMKERQ